MQLPFVSRKQYEGVVYKLECLLCYVTGGRLSKASYDLRTMETSATDYMLEQAEKERAEAARMTAEEIFEEIEPLTYKYPNDGYYSFGEYLYDLAELKKKYTEETT